MRITIKNLKLLTYVGVFESEQKKKQTLWVTLQFNVVSEKAGQTDDLRDTVDYSAIKDQVVACVETRRFRLIEHVALSIKQLLVADSCIHQLVVEVRKPAALRAADYVSVQV